MAASMSLLRCVARRGQSPNVTNVFRSAGFQQGRGLGTFPPAPLTNIPLKVSSSSLLRDSPLLTEDLWATAGWQEALQTGRQLLKLPEEPLNQELFSGVEMEMVSSKLGQSGGADHQALSRLVELQRQEPRAVITLLVCLAGGSQLLESQKTLAATVELLHAASLIHRSVNNENNGSSLDRILILGGDLLFTKAFAKLSSLRNNVVFELLAPTVGDMTEGEMQPPARDIHGWEERHHLLSGCQLARSCQAGLLLADAEAARVAPTAHQLGRSLSLAWQARADIHHVLSGRQLRLTALPVALQLSEDRRLADWVQQLDGGGMSDEQQAGLRELLAQEGTLNKANQTLSQYVQQTHTHLSKFPNCQAKNALKDIIDQLLP